MIRWIILMIGLSFLVHGSDREARDAYLSQQYDRAASHYEASIQQSPSNAVHHYNLATSLYRLNDPIRSKYHILRSLKLNPARSATHTNLRVINQSLIDQSLIFASHWPTIGRLSIDAVCAIMLIISLPLTWILVWAITRCGVWRQLAIVIASIWMVAILVMWGVYYNQLQLGMVMEKKSTIYSGPSQTQSVLFYAHEGAEFRYIRSSDAWHHVQFPNGLKGWIQHHAVISI